MAINYLSGCREKLFFLFLFLLLRDAECCVKFEYGGHSEADYPFVSSREEHERSCQYQRQSSEYLLDAQSAERAALAFNGRVDLG